MLAQALRSSQEAVMWCKGRAERAGDRAAALVPALQELERMVLGPGQGMEVRLVESLSIMLVLLAKVCLLQVLVVVQCNGHATATAHQHHQQLERARNCPYQAVDTYAAVELT
jgi:hypothetical protein